MPDWRRDQHQRDMEVWAHKHPWGAAVMLGNHSQEELIKIWEKRV